MNSRAIYDVMRPMPVFKPEMRKANREGRKSQTRRVVTLKNEHGLPLHYSRIVDHPCPYGKAGDFCYMREPLIRNGAYAFYKDDIAPVINPITNDLVRWRWKKDVLTSIFMPKEAARSIYRYVSIRVERVQDISVDDCWAEGITWEDAIHFSRGMKPSDVINAYATLWNVINDDRGYGWDVNPWVWVLGYSPSVPPPALSATSPILGEHQNGGESAVEVGDATR